MFDQVPTQALEDKEQVRTQELAQGIICVQGQGSGEVCDESQTRQDGSFWKQAQTQALDGSELACCPRIFTFPSLEQLCFQSL